MVQAKVYVVDDDQGMLDSTVWLLESVGLRALPFTGGRRFSMSAMTASRPACFWMCACQAWAGWRYRRRYVSAGSTSR